MNYEVKHGREYLPEEEDIYGVNDSEENEYDYEVWMPYEARLRRRKDRLRLMAIVVIVAFAAVVAYFRLGSYLGW